MPARILLLVFFALPGKLFAQYLKQEAELVQKAENAQLTTERVTALANLASFYYIHRADGKADSVLQKQLAAAELSSDPQMVLNVLFRNGLTYIEKWSGKETFDRALAFIDKSLHYSKEVGRKDYEFLAYLQKSAIYRKRGQYEQAAREVSLAFSSLSQSFSDSLKASLHLEAGDIASAKGDAIAALKHYNSAYDLAYGSRQASLRSEVYHHFASLYKTLGDMELAKKSLLASLQLNREKKSREGMVKDYIELARLYG